jgi:hypothetical protein
VNVRETGAKKSVVATPDSVSPAARTDMPLVQRQTVEIAREPDEPAVVNAAPTTDAMPRVTPIAVERTDLPESPALAAPMPADMPLAARPRVESKPLATSQPPTVQRRVEAEDSEASTFDLSERVLARVTPPDRRTAAKPIDLPLHHQPVVQRESQPQATAMRSVAQALARVENASTSVAATVASPVIQRMPEPVIQRSLAEPTSTPVDSGVIQRVTGVPTEAPEPVDLDQLARQVYPILKRMLAVERERRPYR